MLHLFAEFGIHATWATVGFLFFENKQELLRALPARRPVYTRAGLSPYRHLDAIGENEREDICHFAPSLIRGIADTAHQEIGTHTFSHYYCLEEGQSLDDFRADLESAVRVTRDKLGLPLRSIVFPRNQRSTPHVAVCRELGLLAYRGTLNDWAYRPRSDDEESLLRRAVRLVDAYCPLTGSNSLSLQADGKNTLIDVPGSRYLRPYVPRCAISSRYGCVGSRPISGMRQRRVASFTCGGIPMTSASTWQRTSAHCARCSRPSRSCATTTGWRASRWRRRPSARYRMWRRRRSGGR
jgi:hypothetical protein